MSGLNDTQILCISTELKAMLRSQDWKYRLDHTQEVRLIREAVMVALKRAEGYDSREPMPKEAN
jgi:hypothetical protein